MEESISVRFDDKLGSQKSKQVEHFADIEVQITCTEDKSSETQSHAEKDINSNTTETFEEPIQKRQSISILGHPKTRFWERNKTQSEQDLHSEILKNHS